jgi:hypothetical protein
MVLLFYSSRVDYECLYVLLFHSYLIIIIIIHLY